MSIIRLTRSVLLPRSHDSRLYECRACGTSQFSPMERCHACRSTDVVEFTFE